MPRRLDDVGMLSCAVSADELACIDEMKAMAGVSSDADLVRIALWNFADHLEIDPVNGVFDLRPRVGPKPKDKPITAKAATRTAERARKPQPPPGPNHPWRLPFADAKSEQSA